MRWANQIKQAGLAICAIALSDNTNDSILFIADGQVHELMDPYCKVEITKSDYDVKLIDFNDSDYFQTLRTKMGWGKRGEH